MGKKRHTLKAFNRDFIVKYNFDNQIFRSYIDFIKDKKWGKLPGHDLRRCEVPAKIGRHLGFQVHHILPRCFGGQSNGNNIVLLSSKEHIRAHYLLQVCIENTGNLILANRHGH